MDQLRKWLNRSRTEFEGPLRRKRLSHIVVKLTEKSPINGKERNRRVQTMKNSHAMHPPNTHRPPLRK